MRYVSDFYTEILDATGKNILLIPKESGVSVTKTYSDL
jgi:hypothetical protein